MAAQNFTSHAYYKYYDGSQWQIVSLKSSAADVGVTASRKFVTTATKVNGVAFTLDSSGNGATVTINGSNIGNGISSAGNYITANATLSATLSALDTATKNAYDKTPDSYIKSASVSGKTLTLTKQDNTAVTFTETNTTYESKAAASGGTALSLVTTGEKYTWNNMVPSTRKVNGKALSSDVTLTGSDIAESSSSSTTIATVLSNLTAVANGLTHAYGIDIEVSDGATSIPTGGVNDPIHYTNRQYWNNQFTSAWFDDLYDYGSNNMVFYPGSGRTVNDIKLKTGDPDDNPIDVYVKDLRVGDSIFIAQEDKPDLWVYAVLIEADRITVSFLPLESHTMTWSRIQNKPTLSISGNTVTIGSTSKTFLSEHQTMKYRPIQANGTQVPQCSNTQSTAINFVAGSNITLTAADGQITIAASNDGDTKNTAGSTNDAGVKKYLIGAKSQAASAQTFSHSGCYIGTDNCLYSNSKKVNVSTVTLGTSATGSVAGDIWLDTTAD